MRNLWLAVDFNVQVTSSEVKIILKQLLTKFLPNLNKGKGPWIDEVCNSLLKNWKLGLSNQRVGSKFQAPTRTEKRVFTWMWTSGSHLAHKYYDRDKERCQLAQSERYTDSYKGKDIGNKLHPSSSSLHNLFAFETKTETTENTFNLETKTSNS